MEQPHRGVAAVAADVDMLAEHRELLGQVAVQLVDVPIALAREDALIAATSETDARRRRRYRGSGARPAVPSRRVFR